jgi:hypothetical protein
MLPIDKRVRELAAAPGGILPDELLRATEPFIVRGLAGNWPLVRAARRSATPPAPTCAASTATPPCWPCSAIPTSRAASSTTRT